MADPPPGPRAKIKRAKKHLDDLGSELSTFIGRQDPNSIVVESDPEGGWRARLNPWPEVPVEVALIFGDLIHNLRASLDILACDLVTNHRPQDIHNRTGFPFATHAKTLVAEIVPHKVKGARNVVKQAIIRKKPYERGNQALWQLHQLDILDKHRLVLPTLVAQRRVLLTIQAPAIPGGDAPEPTGIWITSGDPCGMEEGGIIFRDRTRSEPDHDVKFEFGVALNEPGLVDCESIFPFATQLIDVIESSVADFDRFFV